MKDREMCLKKYKKAIILAESNYRARLADAKMLMGEARLIYEDDIKRAKEEYLASHPTE